MAEMNMEELINEIEVYIDNCRGAGVLGGSNMIKVNREEILAMLEELRIKVPQEVAECKQIIRTKDSILADARARADRIVKDAAEEASTLVDNNEIVNLANMRADSIMEEVHKNADEVTKEANANATAVQIGALQYTQNMLEGLETMYSGIISQEKEYFDAVIAKLTEEHKTILANKREIDMQLGSGPKTTRSKEDFEKKEEE